MSIINEGTLKKIVRAVDNQLQVPKKNLFNKKAITENTLVVPTTGLTSTQANFYTTEFIKVLAGNKLTVSSSLATSNVVFYDENKVYISGKAIVGIIIDIPENCRYIRISNNGSLISKDEYQIELGSEKTSYESYQEITLDNKLVDKLNSSYPNNLNINHNKNFFDKNNVIDGFFIEDNNNIYPNSNCFYTEFIPVPSDILMTISDISGGQSRVLLYDKTKKLIEINNDKTTFNTKNAFFVKISNLISRKDSLQLEMGSVSTPYEAYSTTSPAIATNNILGDINTTIIDSSEDIKTDIDKKVRNSSRNIFDNNSNELTIGKYIDVDGNLKTSGSSVTDFIRVSPNKQYVTNNGLFFPTDYMAFYDKYKNLISTKSMQSIVAIESKGFITPSNCFYIRITLHVTQDVKTFQVEKGKLPTPFTPYIYNDIERDNIQLRTKKDLINYDRLISGYYGENGVFIYSDNVNFNTTDYIRVLEGNYYRLDVAKSGFSVVFFDIDKNKISHRTLTEIMDGNGIFQIPKNVYYIQVSFNMLFSCKLINLFYNYSVSEKGDIVPNIKDVPSKNWYVDKVIADTNKYKISFAKYFPDFKLIAINNGFCMFLNPLKKQLMLSDNIDNCFHNHTIVEIADFPEIGIGSVKNAHILRQAGVDREVEFIFIVLTTNSKIYSTRYSSADKSAVFSLSKVWNLPIDMPQMVSNETSGIYKELRILPNGEFNRLNYFEFLNSNLDHHIYSGKRVFEFGSYTGAEVNGTPLANVPYAGVPSCLYSTDDGVNFYVNYMFGFSGRRFKKAGEAGTTNYPRFKFGEDIDTTSYGMYGGGLKAKVRLNIVPSSKEINPTDSFEYLTEVDITGVSNASKGVFTLSAISDIAVGDILTITGTASGNYGLMSNNAANANSGGNGKFFIVTSVSGNNVTLATCVGNPHNPLFCTHIHAINKAWNGVIISTGEEYPESWLIYVDSNRKNNNIPYNYRLNSSELGISRSCGVVVNPDNTMVYASDTATGIYADNAVQPKDRTDKLVMSPSGVWKFGLDDIDDHTQYKLSLGNVFSIYHMRQINKAIYATGQGGDLFLSFNEGDSFEQILSRSDFHANYLGSDMDEQRFYFRSTRESLHNLGEIVMIELK